MSQEQPSSFEPSAPESPLRPRLSKPRVAVATFIAILLVFTGLDKAFHYDGFVRALTNYVLVPPQAAPYLAAPVIVIEVVLGVGLLLPGWKRPAALVTVLLIGLFTGAVLINYLYGSRGVCGCWFSLTLASGTGMHIAQNLLIIILGLDLWWYLSRPVRSPKIDPAHRTRSTAPLAMR